MLNNIKVVNYWTLVDNNRGPSAAWAAMFAAGKYLYHLGGVKSSAFVPNAPIDAWRYDTALNVWAKLSIPVTARSDAGVTANQNYAYIVGGLSISTYLNDIWQFNISSNAWTKLDNYWTALQGVRLCNYNNVLYAVGGGASTDTSALYTTNMANPTVWTKRRDIPIPIRSGCFFSLGDTNYIYYTFGWSNGAANANTYRYSIASDTWSKIADAPRAANNAACTVLDGIAYFYGGYAADTTLDKNVLTFDGVNWEVLPIGKTIPAKRQGASMVTANNNIYMYGGLGTVYFSDLWKLTP